MRVIFRFIYVAVTSVCFAQTPVKYHISFDQYDHHEAEITVTFSDLPDSELAVRMSRTSPGRYALHEFAKNVYRVRAEDSHGRKLAITRPNPHQWNVAGHDGTVKISYTIFGDRCDGTYLAVDNTHAHLNLPAAFMWARGLEERPITIVFEKPDPKWRIATQLVPTDKADMFTAPNLAYFMDSPAEISDFQYREWPLNNDGGVRMMRLALHHDGTEEETDAYVQMCQAVVAEEIAIFEEAPRFDFGSYLFIADYLPHVNRDGMEHRNSTILTSPRSLREHAVRNVATVSHEFFHAWNVERIRPRSLEPFDFEEANMSGELWFAEGFTSYYDGLVLKRAKIISLDRFARDLSRTLNDVLSAPGRRFFSPVEMSQKAPFTDAAVFVDPKNFANTFVSYYAYGAAIGLGLDLTLRKNFPGLTLDHFMRAVWKKHGQTQIAYTNDDLRRILGELTGDTDFANDFFNNYIYGRQLVNYQALLAQAGLLLREANPDAAWIGRAKIEFEDGQATIRSSTLIDSPLYLAGLDREDIILEIDGTPFGRNEELEQLLKEHKPGDQVEIVFNENGVRKTTELVFQKNPELEVVPYEHLSRSLTEAIRAFRETWLGSKSEFDTGSLRRYCPKCRRDFPFEYEYCRYDGEGLTITPAKD